MLSSLCFVEQRFSVAGDDILVPVIAVFLVALQGRFDGFFVLVDIDEAVAFLVAVQPAEQIRERPRAVGEHFRSFFDRQFDFLEVFRQIGDPIRVMDAAVLFKRVESAESVFGNDDRQVIAAGDVAATDADADRIDGPIPIGRRQIGIQRILV